MFIRQFSNSNLINLINNLYNVNVIEVFHRLQRIRDWILSNDSHLENDDTNLLERAQKNRLQHSLRNSNDPETLNSVNLI